MTCVVSLSTWTNPRQGGQGTCRHQLAVLGMMSYGEGSPATTQEMDRLERRSHYWSPSRSQIHGAEELKPLGLVDLTCRAVRALAAAGSTRSPRLGMTAVTRMGQRRSRRSHRAEAQRPAEDDILPIEQSDQDEGGLAAAHLRRARLERRSRIPRVRRLSRPNAYSVIALRWAAKYLRAEREFALQMIKDIDAADAVIANAGSEGRLPGSRGRFLATGARSSARSNQT